MKKALSLLLCLLLSAIPALVLAETTLKVTPESPTTFNLFVDWTWLGYDTFQGGICQDYMIDQIGVTIDMTKATDSEQLNLMIASGELPDLIACSSAAKVQKLSDSDLCWPLQELIDLYIPEWMVPEVEQKLNAYFSTDGNYYMLKNEFNTADEIKAASNLGTNFGQFHIRKDIYDALGAPAIHTQDDFFALLKLVKETYPTMQPIVFNPREYSAFGSLVGYDTVRPTDADGNLVMSLSDPTYKAMLQVMNEMYREGFITKENFAYNSDEQTFQSFYAGNTFMVTHYAGNDEQTFTGKIQPAVPGAQIVQLPLLDNWKYTIPVSGWAALFISKGVSDPERAIQMLYWAKQKDNSVALTFGFPGIDWEYDTTGNIVTLERYNLAQEAGTVEPDYKGMAFPLSADDYITIYNGFYAAATPETRAIFDEVIKRATISNAIDLANPRSGTDLRYQYNDISDLMSECFPKIATADSAEAFEALYADMIAQAEKIGLADVNAYLSKTYLEVCAILGSE